MLNLDSGSGTFWILLDLSAAFDTIDYGVLCDVLQCHLCIYGTALDLFVCFYKVILNQLLLNTI